MALMALSKGFDGVAVVGGDVLLRFEKSNGLNGSHVFMNFDDERQNEG